MPLDRGPVQALTYYDCCWEIACAYAAYAGLATTLQRYRYYCAMTH